MFAGDGTAQADDQIGGFFHEAAVFLYTSVRFEIEIDAHVDAGVSKMTVHAAPVAIAGLELADGAKIDAQLLWRDARILPAFPTKGLSRNMGGHAKSVFADF